MESLELVLVRLLRILITNVVSLIRGDNDQNCFKKEKLMETENTNETRTEDSNREYGTKHSNQQYISTPKKFNRRNNKPNKTVALTILHCLALLGFRNRIIRQLAFFPPKVPGYVVTEPKEFQVKHGNSTKKLHNNTSSSMFFLSYLSEPSLEPSASDSRMDTGNKSKQSDDTQMSKRSRKKLVNVQEVIRPEAQIKFEYHWLTTKRKQKIGTIVLTHSSHTLSSLPLLLYSHGNATDIGYMFFSLYALCWKTKCNILAYEYTGYGLSTGSASEKDTFADVRAAYDFAINTLQVEPKNIISFGQSVGSGPSCDIAVDQTRPTGGLILHSPIASGVRILIEDLKKSPYYDCFCNGDKICQIQSPMLIMHGLEDQHVESYHSNKLFCSAVASQFQRSSCVHQNRQLTKKQQQLINVCHLCINKRQKRLICKCKKVSMKDFALLTLPDLVNQQLVQESVYSYNKNVIQKDSIVKKSLLSAINYFEYTANFSNIKLLLVPNATHNDIELILGNVFYKQIESFAYACISEKQTK